MARAKRRKAAATTRGPKQSQEDFEAEIADDFDERRDELHIEQISPPYRVPRAAYVPVAPENIAAIEESLAGATDWMRGTMRLTTQEKLGDSDYYAGLPPGTYLEVCHHSDRTYVGYPNLYRQLKELAPRLGDARFYIKEDYSTAVDEFRIRGGRLWFERGHARNEYADDFRAYVVAETRALAEDAELRSSAAWMLADHAEFLLDRDRKRTAACLREASDLAPDDAEVNRQAARLAWRQGRPAEADRLFARSLAARPQSRVALEPPLAASSWTKTKTIWTSSARAPSSSPFAAPWRATDG